jgi:hypothetical protein
VDGSLREEVYPLVGIGDEVMVTGEVKRRAAGTMRRFAIRDLRKGGIQRWHEIWNGNPRIVLPGDPFDEWLDNSGGNRPYIETKGSRAWVWKEYKPEPGEIFLTKIEKSYAAVGRGKIIIQPGIKAGASPNKQWGIRNWEKLIESHPKLPWLQIGDGTEPRLSIPFFKASGFRIACAVVSGARSAVLHEGGLHHAAAALGKPSVVIYGGFISPRSTGYDLHRNLFVDPEGHRPLGCGMRTYCPHCEKAMQLISPWQVHKELEALL